MYATPQLAIVRCGCGQEFSVPHAWLARPIPCPCCRDLIRAALQEALASCPFCTESMPVRTPICPHCREELGSPYLAAPPPAPASPTALTGLSAVGVANILVGSLFALVLGPIQFIVRATGIQIVSLFGLALTTALAAGALGGLYLVYTGYLALRRSAEAISAARIAASLTLFPALAAAPLLLLGALLTASSPASGPSPVLLVVVGFAFVWSPFQWFLLAHTGLTDALQL